MLILSSFEIVVRIKFEESILLTILTTIHHIMYANSSFNLNLIPFIGH